MTTDETNQQNPFTRPGFLAAAAFVLLLVVAGIVLGVNAMNRDDVEAAPGAASTSTPVDESPMESPTAGEPSTSSEASACGLPADTESKSLDRAPETAWKYQGTTAYPTSPDAGPAAATREGIRYCFQRSPEGALYAAGNGLVQATDPAAAEPWMELFLAEGPHRDQILADNGGPAGDSSSSTRMSIAGFKVLEFSGDSAVIDVAVNASTQGQNITGSFIYSLVWQDGDWKLSADTRSPFAFQTLPDLSGYIPWGE